MYGDLWASAPPLNHGTSITIYIFSTSFYRTKNSILIANNICLVMTKNLHQHHWKGDVNGKESYVYNFLVTEQHWQLLWCDFLFQSHFHCGLVLIFRGFLHASVFTKPCKALKAIEFLCFISAIYKQVKKAIIELVENIQK